MIEGMLQEGAHHWVGLVCVSAQSSLSAHSAEVEMTCGVVKGRDPLYRESVEKLVKTKWMKMTWGLNPWEDAQWCLGPR